MDNDVTGVQAFGLTISVDHGHCEGNIFLDREQMDSIYEFVETGRKPFDGAIPRIDFSTQRPSSIAYPGSKYGFAVSTWMKARYDYLEDPETVFENPPAIWLVENTPFISYDEPQVILPYVFVSRWDDTLEIYKIGVETIEDLTRTMSC